jgi:antitoxin VapB
MDEAKLFWSGTTQAIRLPKAYRLSGDKVYLKRVGRAIMILPEDSEWQPFLNSLSKFSPEFMADRNQPPQQHRPEFNEDLFPVVHGRRGRSKTRK